MFRIAICENCADDAKPILSMLSKYQAERADICLSVQLFDCCIKLLNNIKTAQIYDLFLLNIIMPVFSGIDFARKLREFDSDVPLIFLTTTADYALDAFRVSAIQYMIKPIDEPEFFSVLDKIISFRKYDPKSYFIFDTPKCSVKISFSEIVYIELSRRALRVHLKNGNILISKILRTTFESAISPLLRDERFVYAHKSFVFNMAHVQEIANHSFVMTEGSVIPVPRYKFTDTKAKYFDYLSRHGIWLMSGK